MTKRTKRTFSNLLLIAGILLFHSSCVTKKRHELEISARDNAANQLNGRVLELNREIGELNLQLAERKGENNVLRELQDKKDRHIERLKEEIEHLTNQSLSQQQLLDLSLRQKQEEINSKEELLQTIQNALTEQDQKLAIILNELQTALSNFDSLKVFSSRKDDMAMLAISEDLLFKPGSVSSAKTSDEILEKIAAVLNQHPEFNLLVKGHTDNQPPKNGSLSDSWSLSAQRAAVVARLLTREFNLNPAQVTVAARGEFEPAASNETAEGRAKNRRVEFILMPKTSKVLRLIREY
jgi:chemotaxis protein MotB